MKITIGGAVIELDADIAEDTIEGMWADGVEVQRVAQSIASLPQGLQAEAWRTFESLVRDRTDRAMTEALAASEGNDELRAALRREYDRVKAGRIVSDRRNDDYPDRREDF
jgi:hypothetical protein